MFDHFRSMPTVCQVQGCQEIVVGEDVWCGWCRRVQCRQHYDSKAHGCRYTNLERYPRKSLMDCLRNLDPEAIKELVERVRPGYTCEVHIPLEGKVLAGAYNVHVLITFDDDKEWLLRTPYQDGPSPSIEILNRIYESEAISLRTLAEIGVPVPNVYEQGVGFLCKDKDVPVVFTLFEKVKGHSLDNSCRPHSKRAHIKSYAKHAMTLANCSFNFVGSFDGVNVNGNVVNTRVGLAPTLPSFGGPFSSLKDMYFHNLDNILRAIRAGTIYRDRPLFEYLAHLDIKDWLMNDKSIDLDEDPTYLWHPDSHSDNMMIGDDQEISSMIDWQGAMTMPKAVAFGGPEWMWGAGPLWDPTNALSNDERYLRECYAEAGRDDLADCVSEGRIHQRLNCFIGGGLGYKESRLHQLRCIETSFQNSTAEHAGEVEAAWIARAMVRHSQDPHLNEIIKFENAKITGRLPQLRYRYISNATLLAILEGVSIIRHGIRDAFEIIKFWGGGSIALA